MKKSWYQKMQDKPGYPKVLILEERFPCYNAVHKMGAKAGDEIVLVNPSEVIPFMADVPEGQVITLADICSALAVKHGVKGCCTLTAGIFTMTIANAVEEVKAQGDRSSLSRIPWWRTLKSDGFLNDKFPGGQEAQKRLLESEGHKVISRGKKYQLIG
ncbi:MAG: MGMT family protein [Anaerolineales bacterium]